MASSLGSAVSSARATTPKRLKATTPKRLKATTPKRKLSDDGGEFQRSSSSSSTCSEPGERTSSGGGARKRGTGKRRGASKTTSSSACQKKKRPRESFHDDDEYYDEHHDDFNDEDHEDFNDEDYESNAGNESNDEGDEDDDDSNGQEYPQWHQDWARKAGISKEEADILLRKELLPHFCRKNRRPFTMLESLSSWPLGKCKKHSLEKDKRNAYDAALLHIAISRFDCGSTGLRPSSQNEAIARKAFKQLLRTAYGCLV